MITSGREHDSLLMMYVMFRLWRHYHHANDVLQTLTPSKAVASGALISSRDIWSGASHKTSGPTASSGFAHRRLRLQNLAAAIHAAFEVDVVRTSQFARILVLDIGRRFEGVGGAAHAAARGRGFASGDGHRSRLRSRRAQSRRSTP